MTDAGAGTAPDAVPETGGRRASWARKVLLALSAAHAAMLLLSLRGAHEPLTSADLAGLALLALLNALAIASLAMRGTRASWYLLLAFVFAAGARWTGEGVEGAAGLFSVLAIAAGVFCVTDPSLRREHGIAA